ncbi:MAG: hypothetical protein QNJ70_17225 [Xenococcaceae cyanobacterium MO_207.B15]|nr:hypothetical protein [Xenococcaceae cyanobacterium MO_207.B15]
MSGDWGDREVILITYYLLLITSESFILHPSYPTTPHPSSLGGKFLIGSISLLFWYPEDLYKIANEQRQTAKYPDQ